MPARSRIPTVRGRCAVVLTLGVAALFVASCQDKPELVEPSGAPATAPAWGSTPTASAAASSSVTFVGAGDIADCGLTQDEATAKLLDGIPGEVFTTGDNAYDDGTDLNFTNCYNPTWGRHKARTHPAPGNHDYHIAGAPAYFAYFGANAGPAGRGYYSFNLGAWHVISLNSEVSMAKGSAQEVWLRQDLAASNAYCTVAYWHKPRWSSGTAHGSNTSAHPIWKALWEYGADLVLEGHEHNYERFAPLDSLFTGRVNDANGIRSFVLGIGGRNHHTGVLSPRLPGSEVFNSSVWGVLKLTLADSGYTWQLVPIAGQTFTDAGSASCHGKPGSPTPAPPPPTPTLKSVGLTPSSVTLDTSATQQFTARDTMSDGTTKTFAGTWTATGGTISTSGSYKAGKVAGSFRAIATEGGKADTSAITVQPNAPPPPPSSTPTLKAIGVSPVSATLSYAATQQFTARDTMSDGSTKAFAGTWAATGGTVSASGMYTAGTTAGAYRLIASEGSKVDTVQVTINAPSTGGTPPPPPPPSDGTVVPGAADRVVLIPGDTVKVGPLGAALILTARAFNGAQEVATPVKWWSGSNKAATFNTSYLICTSPCSMAMTASALGVTKIIIHEYRNGSTAKTDTTYVQVTATGTPVPPSSQPPPSSPPPATLARVIVTPGSASLATGAIQQFSASGVMSDGSTATLSGVTWSATGGSVTSGGSYTAGTTAGTFRVIGASGGKADTSAVTITSVPVPPTSPPPPPSGSASCFDRGPATITLAGSQGGFDHRSDLPQGTIVDASTATWSWGTLRSPVRAGGGANICWHGGRMQGLLDPLTTAWSTFHDTYAFMGYGSQMVVEDLSASLFGDGIKWMESNATGWLIRRVHLKDMHDDCVETDWETAGRIEDVLFEGCYVFLATRPQSGFTVNGSKGTIYVDGAVVWMKPTATTYDGTPYSTSAVLKVDESDPSTSPRLSLKNIVLRVDVKPSVSNACLQKHNIVVESVNNIVVWTGPGDYPCLPIPPGWTLTRDVGVYDRAVSDWKARHPGL